MPQRVKLKFIHSVCAAPFDKNFKKTLILAFEVYIVYWTIFSTFSLVYKASKDIYSTLYYYHHYFYNRIRGFGIVILYKKKNCRGGHSLISKGSVLYLYYFCRGGPFFKGILFKKLVTHCRSLHDIYQTINFLAFFKG